MTVNGADVADVYVVGNYSTSGAAQSLRRRTPDPRARRILCTYSGFNLSGHNRSTINQGTYCGSVSLTGGASLTLNTGTYILEGGLSVGGGTTLTGNNVTLYAPSGTISVADGASVALTPPINGTYYGVVIFEDKPDSTKMTLGGGTSQVIQGAVYAPAAALAKRIIVGRCGLWQRRRQKVTRARFGKLGTEKGRLSAVVGDCGGGEFGEDGGILLGASARVGCTPLWVFRNHLIKTALAASQAVRDKSC